MLCELKVEVILITQLHLLLSTRQPQYRSYPSFRAASVCCVSKSSPDGLRILAGLIGRSNSVLSEHRLAELRDGPESENCRYVVYLLVETLNQKPQCSCGTRHYALLLITLNQLFH